MGTVDYLTIPPRLKAPVKSLTLKMEVSVELIRREETAEDYFATLNFETDSFKPGC